MKKLLCALTIAATLTAANMAMAGGSLKIAGSTTLLPLSQLWAEAFMGKNPSASISVSGGGSGTGLSNLLNGTCDIANASRAAKAKEIDTAKTRNSRLVATKVARDGLSIIVNPANNVRNLTLDQLKAIYLGSANTWKSVGGDSAKNIVVVGRDSSSGTYGFVQEFLLGGREYTKDMLSMPTNAGVCQAVSQSKDAIGYASMAYAEEFEKSGKVRIISLSRKKGQPGMVPTKANVMDGTYPLFRYLYMYTLGNPKGLAGQFVNFALGSEGQKLVTESGYLPLK